jgi:AcrR family transcriptional regulator
MVSNEPSDHLHPSGAVAMLPTPAERRKRPDARRQELLAAAGDLLLAADGGHDIRIEDVTQAAGVAKGTFYLYFESKTDLFNSLREEFVNRIIAEREARVRNASADGWLAQIRAYVEATVDLFIENVRLHDVLFHAVPDARPSRDGSPSSDTHVVQWLANFISDGVVDGAFRVRDPWLTASFLYGATHDGLAREYRLNGRIDRDRSVASAFELLSRALAPQPSAHRASA